MWDVTTGGPGIAVVVENEECGDCVVKGGAESVWVGPWGND